ncbi:MAG: hypothetical protein HZA12_04315 [Nitrospirae bacterium]|nr:hypothetical protein [Nitrospirota bacterium]
MKSRHQPLLTLASTSTFFRALALTFFFFFSSPLEARLLNLNGNIELSYSDIKTAINDDATSTQSFMQRYSLGSFGNLGTSRIGAYNANFSFIDQGTRTDGDDQGDLKMYNYNINANLLPRWYPLSIYAQRVITENEFHQTTKNRTDTFGINWLITTRYLPRISISLNQTDSRFDSSTTPEARVRSASIYTSKSLGPTSLTAGYQLTETDTGNGDPLRFHNYNLGLSGGIPLISGKDLTIGLRANYTTNVSSPTTSTAGAEVVQQRGAGATLSYRPSIEWLSSFSYDYNETPTGSQPFKTHIATANINGRPTTTTDIHTSYRFLLFDIGDTTRTLSNFANIGFGYRPIFGLSTGVEVSGGETDVSSTTDSRSIFQNYTYFVSYSKPLKLIQVTTGYNLTYGSSQSNSSASSNTITNTMNLGISNIETRIVRVSFNYSFTDTSSNQGNDQRSNYYSLSADTSYFRNILRNGDGLYISGTTSYTVTDTAGNTLSVDTRATYYLFANLTFGTGWNHVDNSENVSGNQENIFGEIQWTTSPFRRASLVLSIKETLQDSDTGIDRDIKEARSSLNYGLGKILFNIEYRFTDEDTESSETRTQFFYVKASRPF